MKQKIRLIGCGLVAFAAFDAWASGSTLETAEDSAQPSDSAPLLMESAPRYRTREEAREAGLQRHLTDWLILSTLFETEIIRNSYVHDQVDNDDVSMEETFSLQLGLLLTLSTFVAFEAVVEYDSDENDFLADEAYLSFELDPWELTLGKQYTPFGTYFSRFVSGPMVEFGETQAKRSLALTYGPSDDFDITLMAYQGNASADDSDDEWDWSAAIEAWPLEGLALGLSYQSDLADADERLLREWDDRYRNRVAGASGYMFVVRDDYEFSFEYLTALNSFGELPRDQDRPYAWNAELSRYLTGPNVEIAVRIEGSGELPEMPGRQYGISLTNYVDRHASFTLEYLHGNFDEWTVHEEDEESLEHVNTFGAKLILEF